MSYIITPDLMTKKMNILIYGDPGSGKTHLAGTAQDSRIMKNVHVFNIDGGLMTLAGRGDISATDIHSIQDLEAELYKIANGDPEYKDVHTVVIDNITELETLALESITSLEYKDRIKKDRNYTIDQVFLEDYGLATKQIARILRGFRDLPIHVIYNAHRKDKLRKGTNTLEYTMPSLTDKLATAVMGYMDFVWYLYTADEIEGEGETAKTVTNRYLLTQTLNGFIAKTRGPEFAQHLGTVVKNPNLASIMGIYEQCANAQKENKK